MFLREIFAEKLFRVRNVHNVSNTLLADLVKLRSRSTINNLENQETSPSVELLADLSDLFAVSIDWLSGQSEQPYNLSHLKRLENALYPCMDTGLTDHPERQFFYYVKLHFFHTLKYRGSQHIGEMEKFCPAARANIIFALRVLLYASEKYYMGGYNLDYNLPTLLHDILEGTAVANRKETQTDIASVIDKTSNMLRSIFGMGKKTERAFAELCHFCYFDVLEYYWHPALGNKTYRNDVVFDISKEPQTLKELDEKINYFSKREAGIYR